MNEDELPADAFQAAGIDGNSILRINQQGDIEIRRPSSWDPVGGLIGNFESRLKSATGLDWV